MKGGWRVTRVEVGKTGTVKSLGDEGRLLYMNWSSIHEIDIPGMI